jgi:hypothetical protein
MGQKQTFCAAIKRPYWITLSAVVSSVGGMVRPSAFAALRLMKRPNLVGYSIGRSAGLVPLRMRSMYPAATRASDCAGQTGGPESRQDAPQSSPAGPWIRDLRGGNCLYLARTNQTGGLAKRKGKNSRRAVIQTGAMRLDIDDHSDAYYAPAQRLLPELLPTSTAQRPNR